MTKSVLIHIDTDTTISDTVDAVKDALLALKAPLRFIKGKLCWVVEEEGKPKYLTLTTKRLEYHLGKIGIKFEKKNARGEWESVGAPKQVLKMFLALAEGGNLSVDEWEVE